MVEIMLIGVMFLLAGGIIGIAIRASGNVDRRWQTFAASIGAVYTPRGNGRKSQTIDFSIAGAPTRIFVYLGTAVVNGRHLAYNSLRAIATLGPGAFPEFHQLYNPDLQPDPLLVGDDSPTTRAWLSTVDAQVKTRVGTSLSSDGSILTIDLRRKNDSIADFEMIHAILTKLLTTLPSHATPFVPFNNVASRVQPQL